MVLIDTWDAAPAGKAGTVVVTVPVGPRPLVARLSADELVTVRSILDEVVDAYRRDEYTRAGFADAMRVAIGRDPFRQARAPGTGPLPVRPGAAVAFAALVFAVQSGEMWRQVAGYTVAGLCLAVLAVQALLRTRQTGLSPSPVDTCGTSTSAGAVR
ncbi:hypothetical protein [Actinoplanes sp. NPDC051494]|uniref:hypothetical protein n=1 Tax=Actinoplanes sp. NPDC051494 TaxID=3363907 RepID=UPI00379F4EED